MRHPYNDEKFFTIVDQVFNEYPLLLSLEERQWLHYLLLHEQSSYFLTKEQIVQLQQELDYPKNFQQAIIEKRRPKTQYPNNGIYRTLTSCIEQKQAMNIDYQFVTGERFQEKGIPYKLYFSIHHERWYIWWLKLDESVIENQRRRTPLALVHNVSVEPIDEQLYDHYTNLLQQQVEPIKELTFNITPLYETVDEQWILQAFASFKKQVERNENRLSVTIYYVPEDEGYLLSKIREFGPNLYVTAPEVIQLKMLQTSKKAVARYMND